ncbi:hypothetical protein CLC_2826 [Clostridium botulinum A str. Hall]|nr:hypothetical protein CLB_2894 [Clostridium botulinum A str. ATCC 19397]ABS36034.1 hypothetical protein CLC_2826 [Clostridium botulinum A str. Hall]KON11401.1 hypothetical protein ACP52_00250 [Clostridium botulinum]KOR51566.1 hypothetical protein ADT23_15890 [Clostridium botulinum]
MNDLLTAALSQGLGSGLLYFYYHMYLKQQGKEKEDTRLL